MSESSKVYGVDREYSVSDVPAMSAERVFIIHKLDRSRPIRIINTKEEVKYIGYTSSASVIVHPVEHKDPFYLMVVSGGNLENIPEEGVAYVKVSNQPFNDSQKVKLPFVIQEAVDVA